MFTTWKAYRKSMEKENKLNNELDYINEYSQFFDSTKKESYPYQNLQTQWMNKGDHFEIFTLLQQGNTTMSSETQLMDNQTNA